LRLGGSFSREQLKKAFTCPERGILLGVQACCWSANFVPRTSSRFEAKFNLSNQFMEILMQEYFKSSATPSENSMRQGDPCDSSETEKEYVTQSSDGHADRASACNTTELVTALMYLRDMWLSRDSEGGTFDLSARAWETTLDIAEAYGWEACGTIHDKIEDWGGPYLLKYHQKVVEQDAINIAEALARSISDNFQKLVGTDLEFVPKTRGSANFVEGVMSYIKRGSFYIG
jgi:hypothetical protein